MNEQSAFERDLENLINRYSKENESDTPDFILSNYLSQCLKSYNTTVKLRDEWFGVNMWASDKLSDKRREELQKELNEFQKRNQ